MTTPPQKLKEAIHQFIRTLDPVSESQALSDARVRWLADYYFDTITRTTLKYIDGQRRHGGELEDGNINLRRELLNELLDAGVYLRAITHPMKKPNTNIPQ